MILKVAWRNIWRNRIRSMVIIIAIALGLWAGVFASAFVVGMMQEKVESIIRLEMSDFQIHHAEYRDEMDVKMVIENSQQIAEDIREKDGVIGVSQRVLANAMINSASKNGGVQVVGIDPAKEAVVSEIDQYLDTGAYFEGIKRNPIYLSKRVAEEYNLRIRSKVVLTVQDVNREISAASFRVVGIFNTNNGPFDEGRVYVRHEDLEGLVGTHEAHQIATLLNNHDSAESIASQFAAKHPDLEVLPWLDLATGMRLIIEMTDTYTYYIVGIIMLALLFSIVNTMLMAVLERVRELGMLMAVGMNKVRVFAMIMFETVMLALIGGPAGLILSYLSIRYFNHAGINLGTDVYADLGFSSIIYPDLDAGSYLGVSIMVVSMTIIAAIYPAMKALKLKPAEAVRKI